MTQKSVQANTPSYVLKQGNQSISPTILLADPNASCVCVYGFSDKPIYDEYIKGNSAALTPYPLVKGYLSNQIDSADSDGGLRLVILDATDDAQPVLAATTMATVLLAQQQNEKQVSIEFELVFDPESAGYRFSDKIGPATAETIEIQSK